jgi:phosphate transport system protein
LTRLLDLGLNRIQNIVSEMSKLSMACVFTAIDSYEKGVVKKKDMFEWSEKLLISQDEVSDLAFELIARYQPVATDLRYIRSCLEVSYVLSRFGGYGYEIVDILDIMGSISDCDKKVVLDTAKMVGEMIGLGVKALQERDEHVSKRLYEMDESVDSMYRAYLREIITAKKNSKEIYADPRCVLSALLVMRYLERLADHACYIADSARYIVTGLSGPKR